MFIAHPTFCIAVYVYLAIWSSNNPITWKRSKSESHSVASDSLLLHRLYDPWNSPGQNTGAGSHSLVQVIFPNQGLNPGLLHWRQILYQLSHQGSSRILEWVAYPVSRRSSWPRNRTGVSCIADGFFTNWAIREAKLLKSQFLIAYAKRTDFAISKEFLFQPIFSRV